MVTAIDTGRKAIMVSTVMYIKDIVIPKDKIVTVQLMRNEHL